jgi:hypothetical protein
MVWRALLPMVKSKTADASSGSGFHKQDREYPLSRPLDQTLNKSQPVSTEHSEVDPKTRG